MGSVGGMELLLVLVLALLLFGPRRLPQIGRTIGKALSELRKATTDFKMNLEREVDLEQVREVHGAIRSAGREIDNTVNEFRDPLVARGSLDPAGDREARPGTVDEKPPRKPDRPEPTPDAERDPDV